MLDEKTVNVKITDIESDLKLNLALKFDVSQLTQVIKDVGSKIESAFCIDVSQVAQTINDIKVQLENSVSEFDIAQGVIDVFDGVFSIAANTKTTFSNIEKDIKKIFGSKKIQESASEIGKTIATGIADGLLKNNDLQNALKKTVVLEDSVAAQIADKFKDVGKMITAGILMGIKFDGKLNKNSKEYYKGIIDEVEELFDVQSPSKVMERIGKYISEGLEIGIRKGSDDVVDAAKDLGDGIDDEIGGRDFSFGGLGAAFGVITAIGGAFTTLMSTNEEFGAAVDEVWTQITEASE